MHIQGLVATILTVLLLQHAAGQTTVVDFEGLAAAITRGEAEITIKGNITFKKSLVLPGTVTITGQQLPTGRPELKCGKAACAFDVRGDAKVSIKGVRITGCVGSAIQARGAESLQLEDVALSNHSGSSAGVVLTATQCQLLRLVNCVIHDNIGTATAAVPSSGIVSLVDVESVRISRTNFSGNEAATILRLNKAKPRLLKNESLAGAPTIGANYSANFIPIDPFPDGGLLKVDIKETMFDKNRVAEAVMSAFSVLLDGTFLHFKDNVNVSQTSRVANRTEGAVLYLQDSGTTLHSMVALNNTGFFSVLNLKKMSAASRLYASTLRENVAYDIVRVDGCNLVTNMAAVGNFRKMIQNLSDLEDKGFDSEELYRSFFNNRSEILTAMRKASYFSPFDMFDVTLEANQAVGSVLRAGIAPGPYYSGNLVRWNNVRVLNNVVTNITAPRVTAGSHDVCYPNSENSQDASGVVILAHAFGSIAHPQVINNSGPSIWQVKDSNVTWHGGKIADNVALPGPAVQTTEAFMETIQHVLVQNNTALCSVLHTMFSTLKLSYVMFVGNRVMSTRSSKEDPLDYQADTLTALRAYVVFQTGVKFMSNRFRYMVAVNVSVMDIRDAEFTANEGGGVFTYSPYPLFKDQPLNLTNLIFQQNNLTDGVLGAMVIVAHYWMPVSVDNCTFEGNQVVADGTASGGLYVSTSTNHMENEQLTFCCQHSQKLVNITNSNFLRNRGLQGGGLWIGRPARIEDCTFVENIVDARLPHMVNSSSKYAIVYNTYANETSNVIERIDPSQSTFGSGFGPGVGGAIYIQSTIDSEGLVVRKNEIIRNQAQYGGAVFVDNDCALLYFRGRDVRCRVNLTLNTINSNRVLPLPRSSVAPRGAGNAPAVFFVTSRGLYFNCRKGDISESCKHLPCRNRTTTTPCLAACAEWKDNISYNTSTGGGTCGGLGSQINMVERVPGDINDTSHIPAGVNANFTFKMFDEYNREMDGDLLPSVIRPIAAPSLVLVRTQNDLRQGCSYTFPSLQLMPLEEPSLSKQYVKFVAENSKGPLKGVNYQNGNNVTFYMRPCGLGEYLNLRVCMTCQSTEAALFTNFFNATCQDCPRMGHRPTCQREGFLVPDKGYWQPHMQSPHLHRCPLKGACSGDRTLELVRLMRSASDAIMLSTNWSDATSGRVDEDKNAQYMNTQCSAGYSGTLCGVCKKGYGRLSDRCYKCSGGGSHRLNSALTFIAILILICIVLAITVWCQLNGTHERLAALPLHHQAPVARSLSMTVSTPLALNASGTKWDGILAHLNTGVPVNAQPSQQLPNPAVDYVAGCPRLDESTAMTLIFGEVTSLFKLLVTFIQGLSCLRLLDIQIRIPLASVPYNMDPSEFVSLDCLFPNYDTETKAIIRTCISMFLPVVILIFSTSFWLLRYVFHPKKSASWRTFFWPRILMTAVQIGYYLHQMSTAATVNIFTCYRPPDMKEVLQIYKAYTYVNMTSTAQIFPNPHYGMWTAHYDTECFTGRHKILARAIGLPWMFLFCIGLPITFAFVIWRHRNELMQPDIFLKYGFLYEEYKPKFYWWESVIMLRKMSLLVACTLLSIYGVQIQLISLMMITMVFSLAQEALKPFCGTTVKLLSRFQLNTLERVALFLLGLNVGGLAFVAVPRSDQYVSIIVLVLLLLINLAFAAWVICGIFLVLRILLIAYADYDADGKVGCSDMRVAFKKAVTWLTSWCSGSRRLTGASPPRGNPHNMPRSAPAFEDMQRRRSSNARVSNDRQARKPPHDPTPRARSDYFSTTSQDSALDAHLASESTPLIRHQMDASDDAQIAFASTQPAPSPFQTASPPRGVTRGSAVPQHPHGTASGPGRGLRDHQPGFDASIQGRDGRSAAIEFSDDRAHYAPGASSSRTDSVQQSTQAALPQVHAQPIVSPRGPTATVTEQDVMLDAPEHERAEWLHNL